MTFTAQIGNGGALPLNVHCPSSAVPLPSFGLSSLARISLKLVSLVRRAKPSWPMYRLKASANTWRCVTAGMIDLLRLMISVSC